MHDQDGHHAHIEIYRFCYSSTFLANISSKATRLIKAVCYMEPLFGQRRKVYSDGFSHMTKMATMPIYGKIPLKKSSSSEA